MPIGTPSFLASFERETTQPSQLLRTQTALPFKDGSLRISQETKKLLQSASAVIFFIKSFQGKEGET